jgi:hypothetical protein
MPSRLLASGSHPRGSARLGAVAVFLAATAVLPSVWVGETAARSDVQDEQTPFLARHFELVDLPFDRLPWTGDRPPRLDLPPPVNERGVALFRWTDGRLYVRPGSVAINGMKRIDAFRDTGDVRQLEQAIRQAEQLQHMAIERDGAWWLPFWFDYPPEGLEAPWFNAMSQGLALSFFVRLHRVTGDPEYLRDADRIFASFRRLGGAHGDRPPWVAYVGRGGYLWLEHYPSDRPDHVLNAHMHALIGLYEYWQHTRSPEARRLLEGALTTMRDQAGRYRRPGHVSLYGLRTRTRHYKYHQVHIWQLRLLGRMTGDPYFTELGNALAADRGTKRHVPGKPAESRMRPVVDTAPLSARVAPYPTPSWWLARAA